VSKTPFWVLWGQDGIKGAKSLSCLSCHLGGKVDSKQKSNGNARRRCKVLRGREGQEEGGGGVVRREGLLTRNER
jgi:hypothetical protein